MRLLFFSLVVCAWTAGAALAPVRPPGTHPRGGYAGAFRALRAGRPDRPRGPDGWASPWLLGLAALSAAGAAACWWAFRRRRAAPAGVRAAEEFFGKLCSVRLPDGIKLVRTLKRPARRAGWRLRFARPEGCHPALPRK